MSLLELLEKQHGIAVLWQWVKDWIVSEDESDEDERMPLVDYLLSRAGWEDKEEPSP